MFTDYQHKSRGCVICHLWDPPGSCYWILFIVYNVLWSTPSHCGFLLPTSPRIANDSSARCINSAKRGPRYDCTIISVPFYSFAYICNILEVCLSSLLCQLRPIGLSHWRWLYYWTTLKKKSACELLVFRITFDRYALYDTRFGADFSSPLLHSFSANWGYCGPSRNREWDKLFSRLWLWTNSGLCICDLALMWSKLTCPCETRSVLVCGNIEKRKREEDLCVLRDSIYLCERVARTVVRLRRTLVVNLTRHGF